MLVQSANGQYQTLSRQLLRQGVGVLADRVASFADITRWPCSIAFHLAKTARLTRGLATRVLGRARVLVAVKASSLRRRLFWTAILEHATFRRVESHAGFLQDYISQRSNRLMILTARETLLYL